MQIAVEKAAKLKEKAAKEKDEKLKKKLADKEKWKVVEMESISMNGQGRGNSKSALRAFGKQPVVTVGKAGP